MFGPNLRIHLIDTPGFDDTDRTDTDVLRDIAGYLGVAYKRNIKLSGIVYLHRIVDPRMQGSAKRNLYMFRKLCGSECYKQIALVTTMWSKVHPKDGAKREHELVTTNSFWGHMAKNGSRVLRHSDKNDRRSALNILNSIVESHAKITLQIQRELGAGKNLEETAAGKQLNHDIDMERAKHRQEMKRLEEEMKEAQQTRDRELQEEIAKLQKETQDKIKAGEESSKRLRTDLENLQAEREADLKKLENQLRAERNELVMMQRFWQEEGEKKDIEARELREKIFKLREKMMEDLAELNRKKEGMHCSLRDSADC